MVMHSLTYLSLVIRIRLYNYFWVIHNWIILLLVYRNRIVLEAEASAEAIRVKGDAEAFAIEAKAKAEAEQMARKADAWKDYQEAAMVDMVLETIPKVCHLFL